MPSMDARSLIFDVGDEICGFGRLVHTVDDGDWFDPPLVVPAVGYGPQGPPPPRPSIFGVRIEGADFTAVRHRYARDGAIGGLARVDGVWLGDRIRINRQTDELAARPSPRWSDPPCPPPRGGWPHGTNGRYTENLDFDLGDLEASGVAVTVVIFRPRPDQAVLVVTATDVAAVEAVLRPQLPDRLCVIPSRWTRAQLDQAHEHIRAMSGRWGIYQSGPVCDEQAQATMTATLMRVSEEIADWITTQPAGLIALKPCLAPIRPGDTS